jgi:hypothetical protein
MSGIERGAKQIGDQLSHSIKFRAQTLADVPSLPLEGARLKTRTYAVLAVFLWYRPSS